MEVHRKASTIGALSLEAKGKKRVLVLGIGNLLMGDEGAGVHALRHLEAETLPPHVELLDGGTGGFHLLSCFDNFDNIIMIDATLDGRPPGTVNVLQPRFASDFPRVLSAHDIGLRDLIESATLLGTLPKIILITISIADAESMTTRLSPRVQQSITEVVPKVKAIVATCQSSTSKTRTGKEVDHA